jgi:putative membrane protein insertion efficiency factor
MMTRWLKKLLIAPIKAYQFLLSPWLGHSCRFIPSCSNYAIEAIEVRGPFTGLFLVFKRISRCHPWCQGGHDPVPRVTSPHPVLKHSDSACQQRNRSD